MWYVIVCNPTAKNIEINLLSHKTGFDLVGHENLPHKIEYYNEELHAMKATCEALYIHIPFMFHAEETLLDSGGTMDTTKSNLYDAVLLRTKRIANGFALSKHTALLQEVKHLRNCVDLAPISDEILRQCGNIKEHPYMTLLAHNIPCTVNNTNSAVCRYVRRYESIKHPQVPQLTHLLHI